MGVIRGLTGTISRGLGLLGSLQHPTHFVKGRLGFRQSKFRLVQLLPGIHHDPECSYSFEPVRRREIQTRVLVYRSADQGMHSPKRSERLNLRRMRQSLGHSGRRSLPSRLPRAQHEQPCSSLRLVQIG